MPNNPDNRVFVALDSTDLEWVQHQAKALAPYAAGIKLGLEFFCAHGVQSVAKIDAKNLFLDLKLHDIPNTVEKSVRALKSLNSVQYLTVHTQGGRDMLVAAQAMAQSIGIKLLGVTVLTSLSDYDLQTTKINQSVADYSERLAELAEKSALHGIIASAQEVKKLKGSFPNLNIITPGIRPEWSAKNDQQRIMTPAQAINAGSDYLVIGRPITKADNPVEALQQINQEIAELC